MIAYVSYAAGYATGNFVGILIEQRIAFGIILCRIYTKKNGRELIALFNRQNYGATLLEGTGSVDRIEIVEAVIDRKEMKSLEKIITEFDPDVFYVVEDVRVKQKGIFPKSRSLMSRMRIGK